MSYGSNDTFGDFLAHSVQKLWLLICLPTTTVAGAGVKGTCVSVWMHAVNNRRAKFQWVVSERQTLFNSAFKTKNEALNVD